MHVTIYIFSYETEPPFALWDDAQSWTEVTLYLVGIHSREETRFHGQLLHFRKFFHFEAPDFYGFFRRDKGLVLSDGNLLINGCHPFQIGK